VSEVFGCGDLMTKMRTTRKSLAFCLYLTKINHDYAGGIR